MRMPTSSRRIFFLLRGLLVLFALPIPIDTWADKGDVLCESCTEKGCTNQFGQAVPCPLDFMPGACPPPAGCDPTKPSTFRSCNGLTTCSCSAMPNMHIVIASDGSPFCVPDRRPKECPQILNVNGSDPNCRIWPIKPPKALDPNAKAGTIGIGNPGFVPAATPLNYVVHFENLATATAPAQIVVVTDQLDASKVDLDTFQLGPVSFANVALVPGAGAQTFRSGADLRPEQDIIVTISATLDRSTGLVTWRYASIDPSSGELPDDLEVGFLPPNVNPPAGEGSVAFTVLPKGGLATGTAIQNQAQVVFDTNAPIATPIWLNTIDRDPPITHVLPLASTQSATTFPVQWTGTDAGAGIRDFSVYVSDNGGPFTLWQDHTAAVSANFTGAVGHTYAFFALGTDLVGNAESAKTVAESTTQIVSAPACGTDVDPQVQVTRSGFGYNFATQRFVQTVTLKNISSVTIASPISLVLDNLSSNATLFGSTGTTSCAVPGGSPFINWLASLAPGASASIVLQFTDPTRAGITYATRILAGTGGR